MFNPHPLRTEKKTSGFTLLELLVVIAIIGILAVITFIVIDPIEINRKGHDTVRLADINTLNNVISIAVQEATQSGSQVLCANGIATPCSGTSSPSTSANRAINGTGWVKVDLTGRMASLTVLPVDPVNSGQYVYTYNTNAAGDAWELDAVLESKEYTQKQQKMVQDGGNNDNKFEMGSNLTIVN